MFLSTDGLLLEIRQPFHFMMLFTFLYLILHCPLTEVDSIVCIFRGPAVGRPEVASLEPVEAVGVVLDGEDVVVNGEEVAMAG